MLVLASASPRRAEILASAGIEFVRRPAVVDETRLPGEEPRAYVERLARVKARIELAEGEIALGADTVVVVDGEVLGKPVDRADAERMLRLISGRSHEVLTAFCVHGRGFEHAETVHTTVFFSPLSDHDIVTYVASGEPMDKAGAYAIQGAASKFIERIEGCYFNVVGLPVSRVWKTLREVI